MNRKKISKIFVTALDVLLGIFLVSVLSISIVFQVQKSNGLVPSLGVEWKDIYATDNKLSKTIRGYSIDSLFEEI